MVLGLISHSAFSFDDDDGGDASKHRTYTRHDLSLPLSLTFLVSQRTLSPLNVCMNVFRTHDATASCGILSHAIILFRDE